MTLSTRSCLQINMKLICSVILGTFNFLSVNGQYVQSPCPSIFDYKNDGNGVYGMIVLQPGGPVTSVMTRVNFTIAARLPSSYVGRLEPIGSELPLLQQYNQGVPITYRVHFPVTSPLPRLTALSVNDNILCYGPGDVAGPNLYVSTISLQHVLYLKSGQLDSVFNQYRPAKPDPIYEYFDKFPENGDGYTFNDSDNRYGSWTYHPFLVNNTRPQYQRPFQSGFDRPVQSGFERPVQNEFERPIQNDFERPIRPEYQRPSIGRPETRPQTRPEFVYYPEQPTQATRPQAEPTLPRPQPVPESPPAQIECGIVAGGNERLPLIYNGQSYARGDWPWLVAIYKRNDGSLTFICSGTLVSDRHVITAAHCMQQKNSYTSIKDMVVKVGVYNLEDWGDDITVTRTLASATIHESYNASTLANDILLFTFERTVQFNNNIRPACLWNGNTELSRIVGASGVVAGWGKSELGPGGHGEPRMVRIPVVSTATCRASKPDFHKLTSANTLCAGDRNGAGPCLGDSGGGLYILDNGRWKLRGVVSLSLRPENGDNTCNLNEYIVFTDTAQYLRWINNYMAT